MRVALPSPRPQPIRREWRRGTFMSASQLGLVQLCHCKCDAGWVARMQTTVAEDATPRLV